MFSVNNEYEKQLVTTFLKQPQVPPEVLALRIPGVQMHLKSLDAALCRAKSNLQFINASLQSHDLWSSDIQESFGYQLTTSCNIMAGALDGMAILNCIRSGDVNNLGSMSFHKAVFPDLRLQREQNVIRSLRSPESPPADSVECYASQDMFVDFFSITNFWKHYMPLPPQPTFFEQQRVFDFQLDFGGVGVTVDNKLKVRSSTTGSQTDNEHSGPILHDLIIPVYNSAQKMLHILAERAGYEVRCTHFNIQ